MSTKIHLRRNTAESALRHGAVAACATNPHRATSRRNGRTTYQAMSSEIVDVIAFRDTPAAARCTHCCDAMLVIVNRQRREKGKPPVSDAFAMS